MRNHEVDQDVSTYENRLRVFSLMAEPQDLFPSREQCSHENQEYTFRDYRKCLDCGEFIEIWPLGDGR